MSTKPASCVEIADDLLAAAIGEASQDAQRRVEQHVAVCSPCRGELEGYRTVDSTAAALRGEPLPDGLVTEARKRLETRLADLKQRLLRYRIFPSPLGRILIARSELGIAAVQYLDRGKKASRLRREPEVEWVPGGADLDMAYRDLLDYLHGRLRRLDWPLDLRLARSDFQRSVLQATAALPYGAVASYAGLARELGRVSAVRAVAQALRWNPLPIVIPCHRVVGSSGALTGYAGNKIGLKQRLLSLEGVPMAGAREAGAAAAVQVRSMYVLYPGVRAYCLPTCPAIVAFGAAPFTRIASREHAKEAGLMPCLICRPDLHPVS
ncbi:MAG: methylated-DNA--[protein]-cysteine S-methyltransferase [bacterium]